MSKEDIPSGGGVARPYTMLVSFCEGYAFVDEEDVYGMCCMIERKSSLF